ncbi:6,7-dimethyl-8-ribityllumazine synthase [Candidatus Peregrinibacteria bacterium]|nr:6,7-dimethyl-8-ribityllumazine synthase [Candidatus Peregrinibacteria bacterium]
MNINEQSEIKIDGSCKKIGIVFSRFNDSIGIHLYNSIIKTLKANGVKNENIITIKVPGSLETPIAAKKIIDAHSVDAVISIGVVIKGGTYHFELVCNESHRGLMDVSLATGIPIIFGIITAYSAKDAEERAREDKMNKGKEYALAALEMANI